MKTCTFLIAPLMLASCEKDNPPKKYTVDMPNQLVFTVIDHNGTPLISQPDQKVNVYLFVNGVKRQITDYRLDAFPDNLPLSGYYYSSMEPPIYSADSGIKEFYLEMNNDIDTIYVDVEKHRAAPPGGGLYTYREVRFNGKVVPNLYPPNIYVYTFQKR